MSTTEHTAEPWKVEAHNRIVSTDTGWGIGECFVSTAQPLPLAKANAARIVVCVNVCAEGETLHALLVRLARHQTDAAATAHERVNAADAASILRALGR